MHNNFSPTNVIILGTGEVAENICRFLCERGDTIQRLYLSKTSINNERIIEAAKIDSSRIFWAKECKEPNHIDCLQDVHIDYIITVYWPYLLKRDFFSCAKKGTVNFHPALLPVNRGWYPHVHSIIDGTPLGVTIHSIDDGADTGDIWAQKKVDLLPTDTAKEVYCHLQDEITKLFLNKWDEIVNGICKPYKQDESIAIYHDKEDVEKYNFIDINKTYKAIELINILKARSFGNRGFAYYLDNGEKVYLNLRLSHDTKMVGS